MSKVVTGNLFPEARELSLMASNTGSLVMDTLCDALDRGGIALTGLCCCFSDQRQQATSKMTGYIQQPAVRGAARTCASSASKAKLELTSLLLVVIHIDALD